MERGNRERDSFDKWIKLLFEVSVRVGHTEYMTMKIVAGLLYSLGNLMAQLQRLQLEMRIAVTYIR